MVMRPLKSAKKKKLKSLGKLKKELWALVSADIKKEEENICFTCGRYCEGSGCHGGHYITKSIGGVILYFERDNIHVQCYNCNINLAGNIRIYTKKLGAERVERLEAMIEPSRAASWGRKEYEERIDFYKNKLSPVDF